MQVVISLTEDNNFAINFKNSPDGMMNVHFIFIIYIERQCTDVVKQTDINLVKEKRGKVVF